MTSGLKNPENFRSKMSWCRHRVRDIGAHSMAYTAENSRKTALEQQKDGDKRGDFIY